MTLYDAMSPSDNAMAYTMNPFDQIMFRPDMLVRFASPFVTEEVRGQHGSAHH